EIVVGGLVDGLVLGWPEVLIEAAFAHVGDDADDFAQRLRIERGVADLLADGIFAGKVFARERLIDDEHVRLRRCFIFREDAAADETRFQRSKVSRTDVALIYLVMFAVKWLADNPDPVGVA